MSARTPFATVAFAAALACSLVITACAAPTDQAATPPSSTSSVLSSSAASAGPRVTVPGLSSAVSSAPVVSSEESTNTPTPEPVPEPEPAEPPQIDDPADDFIPEPEPEPEPEPAPAPAPAPEPAPAPISGGRVVVIDPGHNGANGANPDIINQQVDAGFGRTKPCNTTGTSTSGGFTEASFNWKVAGYLRPMLEAGGMTVVMTRESNDGVGPCVNKRAAIGNSANADAVVSIHGDGADGSIRGFYVMTAEQDPAGAGMAARSRALAVAVRDGLGGAGLSPSNGMGSAGLWPRNDLAGLNLSLRPTVMIEAGNMRNSADAALMTSDSGQQQVARGLADGLLAYLGAG